MNIIGQHNGIVFFQNDTKRVWAVDTKDLSVRELQFGFDPTEMQLPTSLPPPTECQYDGEGVVCEVNNNIPPTVVDTEPYKIAQPMPQGIQTNFPHFLIRRTGCLILTIFKWVEVEFEWNFSIEDIVRIYGIAVDRNIIRENHAQNYCFLNDNVAFVNLIVSEELPDLPNKRRFRENPRYVTLPAHFQGRAIRQLNNGAHFDLLMFDGKTWDSLDPNRPQAANYRPTQYRSFV
jgi:hypothetical protein